MFANVYTSVLYMDIYVCMLNTYVSCWDYVWFSGISQKEINYSNRIIKSCGEHKWQNDKKYLFELLPSSLLADSGKRNIIRVSIIEKMLGLQKKTI